MSIVKILDPMKNGYCIRPVAIRRRSIRGGEASEELLLVYKSVLARVYVSYIETSLFQSLNLNLPAAGAGE